MPEIKNQFTGGKMNKDLDERLVPKNEYRDAMNIQVATSEGSDVGAIENILGNTLGCTYSDPLDNPIPHLAPSGSYATVGSISDEKNDSLYWLVAGPNNINDFLPLDPGQTASLKDMIMRKTVDGCEPVFVDQWGYCMELQQVGESNSVVMPVEANIENITVGMYATGYGTSGVRVDEFLPTLVTGVGALEAFYVSYQSQQGPGVSVIQSPSDFEVGFRTFWHIIFPSGGDYSDLTPDVGYDGTLQSQANVPENGQSQVFLTGPVNPQYYPVGTTITSPYYSGGGTVVGVQNTLICSGYGVTDPMTGALGLTLCQWVTVLTIDTVPDSLPSGLNPTPTGLLSPGENLYVPFIATFSPPAVTTYTPTNVINVWGSDVWLDEIYNLTYNDAGVFDPLTGSNLLQVNMQAGAGINAWNVPWYTNCCIDPNSVSPPDPVTGSYDSEFSIVPCNDFTDQTTCAAVNFNPYNWPLHFDIYNYDGAGEPIIEIQLADRILVDNAVNICFTSERALNFDANRLITGINLIDDMLFWTDNFSEPKKVNIPRSITGTNPSGNKHTAVVNSTTGLDLVNYNPIREENITVIRKSPKSALLLEAYESEFENPNNNYSGIVTVSDIINLNFSTLWGQRDAFVLNSSGLGNVDEAYDFSGFSSDPSSPLLKVIIKSDLEANTNFNLDGWGVGSTVVLKEFDDSGNEPTTPIIDYRIKGKVVEWFWASSDVNDFGNDGTSTYGAKVAIAVDSIVGSPPEADPVTGFRDYAIELFNEDEKIFEFKFPRFSYRYKFEDGEYSTFAPWTSVAFIPGLFDYHPTKGYNLGMSNRLNHLNLTNFVTQDIPLDVVEIDILYKEDQSPNVYVVETLRPNAEATISEIGSLWNNWQLNKIRIDKENIRAVLPSNQTLRPWDNIPKKALGQEITGNRVVYGNYVQNYNLTVNNSEFIPSFTHSLNQDFENVKSIKSLREYQLGVVFTDKYGRETPVITNNSGTFKVKKDNAVNANKLKVSMSNTSGTPLDMKYFKFYIKETSGEYYNLAMDRYYDAEDGNVWMSFPSTDRNKIDIDSFIILKKGVDSNELVLDPARFKVIAIENQAPDFIKIKKTIISELQHTVGSPLFTTSEATLPTPGDKTFSINYDNYMSSSIRKLHEQKSDEGDIYFQIKNPQTTKATKPQKIARLDITGAASVTDEGEINLNVAGNTWKIVLEEAWGSDVLNYTDSPDGINVTKIEDNNNAIFWNYKVENSPEFDGRFFVKVFVDDTFRKYIIENSITTETVFNTVVEQEVFSFKLSRHKYAWYDVLNSSLGTTAQAWPKKAFTYKDHDSDSRSFKSYWTATANMAASSPFVTDSMHPGQSSRHSVLTSVAAGAGQSTSFNWAISQAFFRGLNIAKAYRDSVTDGLGAHGYEQRRDDSNSLDIHGVNSSNELLPVSMAYQDVWFVDYTPSRSKFNYGEWRNKCVYDPPNGCIWPNNGSRNIEFGFGGIQPSKTNWESGKNGISNWGTRVDESDHDPMVNHFDLKENNHYKGDAEGTAWSFAQRLDVGTRFRWRQDPTQTIYTIIHQAEENLCRFERNASTQDYQSFAYTNNVKFKHMRLMNCAANDRTEAITEGNRIREWGILLLNGINTSTYFRPGNFSHNYKVQLDKDIVWNPTQAGPITNGRIVSLSAEVTASPLTGNTLSLGINGLQSVVPLEIALTKGMVLDTVGGILFEPMVVSQIIVGDGVSTSDIVKLKFYDGTVLPTTQLFAINSGDALIFRQYGMNGLSPNSCKNINYFTDSGGFDIAPNIGYDAVGYTVEIIEQQTTEGEMPRFPAVWETEPKESTDLDIYYEITDNNATYLNVETIKSALPIGSFLTLISDDIDIDGENLTIVNNNSVFGNEIEVSELLTQVVGPEWPKLLVEKPNGQIITVQITGNAPSLDGSQSVFTINPDLLRATATSSWHNCYSFGNGVESNRIRDSFNLPYISNGVKVSTTLSEQYKEEHRKYGLIYSGIYNSTSGVNNLNQFIQAEKITKDINPTYGSIQKLQAGWGQGGDLIALCEDRILKILANKDALFNADGNTNVTATNKVLGTATPYSGEYGISTNPESFASEAYRAYFTDKVRGTVMRLSMDGLTSISNHGMKDWFRDNLKLSNKLIGSYDDKKDEYNITLEGNQIIGPQVPGFPTTVSFREDVKGWSSFKSFVPENAISCANEYYTFKNANLWRHHDNNVLRNTFYNTPTNLDFSSVTAILNDSPGSVKSFNTLNYEGSQTKVTTNLQDSDYYNLNPKEGWYVDNIFTNKEIGSLPEFIEKEGKWFNYIKGESISHSGDSIVINQGTGDSDSWDHAAFAIQGLGVLNSPPIEITSTGCMDSAAFNYNPDATIDDGSCVPFIDGCTMLSAFNYNTPIGANNDDGSCLWYGCNDASTFTWEDGNTYNTNTNITTFNDEALDPPYSGTGIVNQGCNPTLPGCTTLGQFNYDPLANTESGGCIPVIEGCMIESADGSVDPAVNTDDGTCTWSFCFNPDDDGYIEQSLIDSSTYITSGAQYGAQEANCQNGGCMDATALNYNGGINDLGNQTLWDNDSCILCDSLDFSAFGITGTNDETIDGYDNGQLAIYGQSTAPDGPFTYILTTYTPFGFPIVYDSTVVTGQFNNNQELNYGSNVDSVLFYNLPPGTYTIQVQSASGCIVDLALNATINAGDPQVDGCMNPVACNFDPLANVDDSSCVLPDGCNDPIANNYDANATCDDGSCTYDWVCYQCGVDGLVDLQGNTGPTNTGCDGLWLTAAEANQLVINATWSGTAENNPCVSGCMDNITIPAATNYDPNATWDSVGDYQLGTSSCEYPIEGCTDPTAVNYDDAATIDDDSCCYIEGCMDVLYVEYNPDATCDPNNLCENLLETGCTDTASWDYDANATPGLGGAQNPNICSFCTEDPTGSNYEGIWNLNSALSGDYFSIPSFVLYNGLYYTNSVNGTGPNSGNVLENSTPGNPPAGGYDGSYWVACSPLFEACEGPIFGPYSTGYGYWQEPVGIIVLGSDGTYYSLVSPHPQNLIYDPTDPTSWPDGNTPWAICSTCNGCG